MNTTRSNDEKHKRQRDMLNQRERAERYKRAIIHDWQQGSSISQLARDHGVSRAVINRLLEVNGVRGESPDKKSMDRESRRQDLIKWLRENPGVTINDAADALGLSPRTVSDYLVATEEEMLIVTVRGKPQEFSREEMLASLRRVFWLLPEEERSKGLSKSVYAANAGDGPSVSLFEKRFPSWRKACEEAGVMAVRQNRRVYTRTFTDDDLLSAVAECMEETGDPTFANYTAWAQESGGRYPSGALVLNRLGRWSEVRRKALARRSAA